MLVYGFCLNLHRSLWVTAGGAWTRRLEIIGLIISVLPVVCHPAAICGEKCKVWSTRTTELITGTKVITDPSLQKGTIQHLQEPNEAQQGWF